MTPLNSNAHSVSQFQKVLFIDSRVPDLSAIVAAARPGVNIVVLHEHSSGLAQMVQALEGEQGLLSISVVSHGDAGLLLLGNGPLFAGDLPQHQAELQAIGAALAPGGDLLLYGCDVGAGDKGAAFVAALAQATGADVAASTDRTGSAALGGNWVLESHTGVIDAAPLFSGTSPAGFEGLLSANNAPTFAPAALGTGKVVTDIGSSTTDLGNSVTVQADGKILVAGYSTSGGSKNFAVVRYNTNGSLDMGFNSTGKVVTDIGSSTTDFGNSVTVQADGKIVVAGYSNSGGSNNFAVVRYNTNGSLDMGFNSTGKVVTDIGSSSFDRGQSVTVQADGKIVVAGYGGGGLSDDFLVVRYNTNGSLDNSFNGTGKVITDIGSESYDSGYSVTLQADGKIVVAGDSDSGDFAVARYNADGSLDTTFNGTGKLVTDIGSSTYDIGRSVAVQADGKIVVVGTSNSGSGYDFAVVRYNADGSLDTTFNGTGKLVTDIGSSSNDYGNSVTVQADGKIVVAGDSNSGGSRDFAVVRYNADGTLDTSFGAGPAANTLGGTVAYTENAAAIALDASVAVFDAELAALNGGLGNYSGASVTLARSVASAAEDVFSARGSLSFVGGDAVLSGTTVGTVTNTAGTLTITFNASATQARVNEVLSSIGYANTSDAPPTSVQIDWRFSDGNTGAQGSGGALTAMGSTTVNIMAVNDAPTLSGVSGTATAVTVGVAAALVDFTVADPDGADVNLTVTLTATNGTINNLTDADTNTQGIQLSGTAADINTAIAGATFTATAAGAASIGISVSDGAAAAVTGTYSLTAAAAAIAPTVTTSAGATAFEEGNNAVSMPVTIDGAITAVDIDSPTLASATVAITGGFQAGADELAFTNSGATMGDISASYNAGTGVLTLTSLVGATAEQYQAALRSVTYSNSSELPTAVARTIGFSANDGSLASTTAFKQVTVMSVNDAPINQMPMNQAVLQGASLVFSTTNGNRISISDAEADDALFNILLVATGGVLTLPSATGLTVTGNSTNSATIAFEGLLNDVNAALDGLVFTPAAGYHGTASLRLQTYDKPPSARQSGDKPAQDDDTIDINVTLPSAQVTGVSATVSDDTYGLGAEVTIVVVFDQTVVLDTTGGTPSLLLKTGATDRSATYLSGSGEDRLYFLYTVQAGDVSEDLDYVSTAALALNGATLRNASDAHANLTLPALGSAQSLAGHSDIKLKGFVPVVLGVSVPDNGTYGLGQNLDFTVHMSETVTVDTSSGTPRIAVLLDTGTAYARYLSGSGTSTLVFCLSVERGQSDGNGISVGSAIDLNGGAISGDIGDAAALVLYAVQPIDGVYVDATPPVLQVANATGNQLVLGFIEATTLDAANIAPADAFVVLSGGAANAVTAVSVNAAGRTVTLTLERPVVFGETVNVAYTDPTADNDQNTIQDAAGNDAASFAALAVNNTLQPGPVPDEPGSGPAPVLPAPAPVTPVEPPALPPATSEPGSGPAPVLPAPVTPVEPPALPSEQDKYGIPAAVEDSVPGLARPDGSAPVAGDGNGDGIKDSLQAEVASVAFVLSASAQSSPGAGVPTFTTLVASSVDGKVNSGTANARITSLKQLDAPSELPEGLNMPIGLISFTVALASGVSSESFSLYLDPALGINGYWKQDSAGTWVNIASAPYGGKVVMEGGRIRLDFEITDGGAFDADGKADGVITDPGAPAYLPLSIVGHAPAPVEGGFWF